MGNSVVTRQGDRIISTSFFTLIASFIFLGDAVIRIYKNISIIWDLDDDLSLEEAKTEQGKKRVGKLLAQLFDTEPPKEQDGGTITKSWIDSIHRLKHGKRSGLKKQDIVRKMVGWRNRNEVEDYLSQGRTGGSTVAGPALWMIYERELKNRRWKRIFSYIVVFGSLLSIVFHIISL